MPINRHVITFLSIVASGIESPITAIIKTMAVPSGMPFATKTSMMGTMPAALAYIGTARMTASGTLHQFSADRYCLEKPLAFDPRGRSCAAPRKRFYFDPIRALAGGGIFISSYLPAFILRTLSPMSSI